MRNEFTAIFELDDSGDEPRYVAYCIEVPGAHADGKTMADARDNLADAIKSALQAQREKTMRDISSDLSPDATQEVIAVQETISLY